MFSCIYIPEWQIHFTYHGLNSGVDYLTTHASHSIQHSIVVDPLINRKRLDKERTLYSTRQKILAKFIASLSDLLTVSIFLIFFFSRMCKSRSHFRYIALNFRDLSSLGLISLPHMFHSRHETKQVSKK